MTIADRLTDINNTKLAIKASIEAKGQTVGSIPFSEYPSKIDAISGGGSSPVINEWVRPSDWLPITKPDGTSQKVVGLFAVFDSESNYVSFTATGAYTVNWGDGSAPENYANNVQCQHKYTFASIDPATTTAEGYRQVVITITPQAGQNLISINFQKYHSEVGGNYGYTAWLELYASTSNADVLGGLSNWMSTQTMIPMLKAVYILPCNTVVDNRMGSTMFRGQAENVEYVEISRPNVTLVGAGIFSYLRLIKKFNFHSSIKATTTAKDLFLECNSLVEAPMIDLSNCPDTSYMFSNCSNLQTVPQYVTTNVTFMSYMFNGCRSLETVPLLNMQNNTNMQNMFSNCYALKEVPLFNTAKVTSFQSAFGSCENLRSIPSFNTSKVTSFSSAFSTCNQLRDVPLLDTSSCTDFSNMFSGCYSLVNVPTFNTSNATNMSSMFYSANALKSIPLFNTSKCTTISNLTGNANRFQVTEIPAFDMRKSSGLQNLGSSSIWRFKAYGFISPLSVANNMLAKRELNEIIENLGNPTASQSLTISNNPGATSNPTYSRSSTTTAGSAVVLVSDTSNFIAGETQVTGTGITNSRTVTLTDSGDLVTLVGHGLPNGKRVSFNSITTTTGISVYRPYYVVNATTDTFQLSLTQGGTPIALTNNGTGTVIYQTLVIAIDPNVSVTVDVPASASGTSSLAYRNLNTQIAIMKRWTVSG